jgi:hypothetical protein
MALPILCSRHDAGSTAPRPGVKRTQEASGSRVAVLFCLGVRAASGVWVGQ